MEVVKTELVRLRCRSSGFLSGKKNLPFEDFDLSDDLRLASDI